MEYPHDTVDSLNEIELNKLFKNFLQYDCEKNEYEYNYQQIKNIKSIKELFNFALLSYINNDSMKIKKENLHVIQYVVGVKNYQNFLTTYDLKYTDEKQLSEALSWGCIRENFREISTNKSSLNIDLLTILKESHIITKGDNIRDKSTKEKKHHSLHFNKQISTFVS